MFADCCATTAFLSLRSQRRPCRAEIEEKLLPLLRPGVRTSSFPRSARHARYRHSPLFRLLLARAAGARSEPCVARRRSWRAVLPGRCLVSEFANRANTHAAPLAHGFIGSNDA